MERLFWFTENKMIQYVNSRKIDNSRKTVYLLTINGRSMVQKLVYYLFDDYNIRVVNSLRDTTKRDIIIPMDVAAQTLLYNRDIYSVFDDKKRFYDHLSRKHSNHLKHVKLIPSYDEHYHGDNISSKFLLKPIYGSGSQGQLILEGKIFDIIDKYADAYQIQTIIDIQRIYEVEFACESGVIRNKIMFETIQKTRTANDYVDGIESTAKKIPKNIMSLCKAIISDAKYDGFIEFEFIQSAQGTIYIMECNPRIAAPIENPLTFRLLIENRFGIQSTFCKSIINKYEYNKPTKMYNVFDNLCTYIKFKLNR
jgi:hypothetical protein